MQVVSVSLDGEHGFSKRVVDAVELLAGLGVQGDTHAGVTVQHRSRVARNPAEPNLRQVHLIHRELLDELAADGHPIDPGQLGENITIAGVDLLGLPTGTELRIGPTALITVTGLRNPCRQIEKFQPGLLARVTRRGPNGEILRLAGVMAVVTHGGRVAPGDAITVTLPPPPRQPLVPV